jgi:RNA polymerase sigma-54 factor
MALGPRLDLRQSQSLVMTPQLQQAIKLLALSNLEIEAFIGEALEANPLLDVGTAGPAEPSDSPAPDDTRRTTLESSPADQLIAEGRGADDRPLDIDTAALDRDRDTGDWSAEYRSAPGEGGPDIDERGAGAPSLAEHIYAQIGTATRDPRQAFIARHIATELDEAGYLPATIAELAGELAVDKDEVEVALALVQSLDPTGVAARSLGECLALQAREADRYDPCMAKLLDNLDLLARGEPSCAVMIPNRACGSAPAAAIR